MGAFTVARAAADLFDQLFRWRPDVADRWLAGDDEDPRAALLRELARRADGAASARGARARRRPARRRRRRTQADLPATGARLRGGHDPRRTQAWSGVLDALSQVRDVLVHLVVPSATRFDSILAVERPVGDDPAGARPRRRGRRPAAALVGHGERRRREARRPAAPPAHDVGHPRARGHDAARDAARRAAAHRRRASPPRRARWTAPSSCTAAWARCARSRSSATRSCTPSPRTRPSRRRTSWCSARTCRGSPPTSRPCSATRRARRRSPTSCGTGRCRGQCRSSPPSMPRSGSSPGASRAARSSTCFGSTRSSGASRSASTTSTGSPSGRRPPTSAGGWTARTAGQAGLPATFDAGTWRRALDRLVAGVALPEGTGSTTLSLRAVDVGHSLERVGALCELVDALGALRERSPSARAPSAAWCDFARDVVDGALHELAPGPLAAPRAGPPPRDARARRRGRRLGGPVPRVPRAPRRPRRARCATSWSPGREA